MSREFLYAFKSESPFKAQLSQIYDISELRHFDMIDQMPLLFLKLSQLAVGNQLLWNVMLSDSASPQ